MVRRATARKKCGREDKSAQMYSAFCWSTRLLARMSCARICPYKPVGCCQPIRPAGFQARRCDCSFVLAVSVQTSVGKLSSRRRSAVKWERVSASKPQASFPHYLMPQQYSPLAGSPPRSTAQPMRSARACLPSRPQQHFWELWHRVHRARARSVLGRA